jgi:hypothetical protein
MKCAICGISVDTIEDAIVEDWVPCFFEGHVEHGPLCASCSEQFLFLGEDGEYELKKEYMGKIVYDESFMDEEEDFEESTEPQDIFLGFILN